jgi:hypothetical protein
MYHSAFVFLPMGSSSEPDTVLPLDIPTDPTKALSGPVRPISRFVALLVSYLKLPVVSAAVAWLSRVTFFPAVPIFLYQE